MLWRVPLLCLLLLSIPLASITIGKVSFNEIGNSEDVKLRRASGLTPGQDYSPEAVIAATARLYDYYHSQGQYFVQINAPELIPINDQSLELVYSIREHIPSHPVLVRFQGMNYFSEAKLYQLLLGSTSHEYSLDQLPRLMQQVLNLYHERSYLFAAVKIDSLALAPGLIAYIGIDEGKPLRVKEYIFRGNNITRDKTLLNVSGLSRVKTITPAIISQAEDNIMRKSYIRDCIIEPIDDSSLLIKVEESRMTYMEGVLGVNSVDGNMRLSGQIKLQFMNLWGTDRAVNLLWRQIPAGKKEISLAYHESGFTGFPMAADLELYRSEQDSTWIKSRAALDVYYLLLHQKIGVALVAESINPGSRRPSTIETSKANRFGAFWNFRKVEGGDNPVRGIETNLRYSYQNGADSKLHAAWEAGGKYYFPITQHLVGHIGAQIRNLDNQNAKSWEQFTMGGYGSLRGYHEDEFSSFRLAWTNYELRYLLNPDSRVYLFFDQGFVARDLSTVKTDLFGVGAGIKVKTRLGILGLEYGLGYRDKRFSRIGLGMVHAGLDVAL